MALLLYSILTLVVLAVGKLLYTVHRARSRVAHIPGPPEYGWFLGNAGPEMKDAKDISKLWISWSRQFDSPVTKCRFITQPFVLINSPEEIYNILMKGLNNYKPDHTFRREHYEIVEKVFGGGILTTWAEAWRWRKNAWLPHFKGQTLLNDLVPVVTDEAQNLQEKLSQHLDELIQIDTIFAISTITVIARYIFGRKLSVSGEEEPFLTEYEEIAWSSQGPAFLKYYLTKLMGGSRVHKNYVEARKKLKALVSHEIDLSIAELKNCEPHTPIHFIIQEHGYQKREAAISEIFQLLFAGHDTTAHTMSFALALLTKNPKKLKKLMVEVNEVMEAKEKLGEWNSNLISKLEYLSAVVKETLRMYPIAWSSAVRTKVDVVVAGVKIPYDEKVMLHVRDAYSNPKYFEQPEKFRPERYIEGHRKQTKQPSIAFSVGPHACLGKNLAFMESKIFLATLLRNFKFSLKNPDEEIKTEVKLTLKPFDGMPLIVSRN